MSEAALAKLAAWRGDAELFVREVLGAEPEPWQVRALGLLSRGDRVAVRSGHGVGKTTLIAWAVLWFMLTRFPCQVPVTANSQNQLRDAVWAAINLWARRLPQSMREQLVITAERVMMVAAPTVSFAVARTASAERPEALQGFHADYLLFVLEEASGIPEKVIQVAYGALSTPGAKILAVGNPTRTDGFFFDVFHRLRESWATMVVSSEEVPRAMGHIKDIEEKYGKDSNVYRVRVLGEFPIEDDDVLIPLYLVEQAIARWKEKAIAPIEHIRPIWGVDVAYFGDDWSTLAKRHGNVMKQPVRAWHGHDTMQMAGQILMEYENCADDEKPAEIIVDVIGYGAGVVDRLREMGLGHVVRGLNVSEGRPIEERFMRPRDELWFRAREWFQAQDCGMVEDAALIADLTGVRYKPPSSSGKMRIEPKDETKERIGRSPDRGDAFVMTFAGGIVRDEVAQAYAARRKRPRSSGITPWAA